MSHPVSRCLWGLFLAKWLCTLQRLGDIRVPNTLAAAVAASQPAMLLHLAAQPLVQRSYRDPLGTWATKVLGARRLLEALRPLNYPNPVVKLTTGKVYANQEWDCCYRESGRLGGQDP